MSTLQINLNRQDASQTWGFRLLGGTDYNKVLTIDSVKNGGLAASCGLQQGDTVLAINGHDAGCMTHEAAKMEIIRSCNDISFTVLRGAGMSTVSQVNCAMPQAAAATAPAAAPAPSSWLQQQQPQHHHQQHQKQQQQQQQHNSASSFAIGRTVTTTPGGRTKQVFHNNYNSPAALYANNYVQQTFNSTLQAASQDCDSQPVSAVAAAVAAEDASQRSVKGSDSSTPRPNLAGASMYCGCCGDMIKGVFVKVQGRVPMHPECLKCAKCGVGLRHCGYFYIEEKLYCETHAKQVAAPPEPGLMAVPVYK